MKNNIDLLISSLISIILVPLVLFTNGIARAALGILFMFFIPGYSLISGLFPSRNPLGNVERFVLSIVVSIAISVLTGIILNFTPFGISLLPAIVLELACTLLFCILAWLRRNRLSSDIRFSLSGELAYFKRLILPEGRKYWTVVLCIVVVIVVTLLGTMYLQSSSASGSKTNEFYLLSVDGTAEHYPNLVHLHDPVTIRAIIINHEEQPVYFTLRIAIGGNESVAASNVQLKPGEKWDSKVTVYTETLGNSQKVEYRLFRANNHIPENALSIYIDVLD